MKRRAISVAGLIGLTASAAWSQDSGPRSAMEQALASPWRDLHMRAECLGEDGFRSVEVFGSGVAIWNNREQITLSPEMLRAQLDAYRQSGFASMDPVYGPKPSNGSPMRTPPRITCHVALRLDDVQKEVFQQEGGEPFRPLRELADRILDIAGARAGTGVTAEGLDDGLRKIAAGELASETLRIVVQRREAAGDSGEKAWVLRLEGNRIVTQDLPSPPDGKPGRLELGRDEMKGIASRLARLSPASLPRNLYALHYTDLIVRLLDHEKHVQARAFGRLTPSSHPEAQKSFAELFETFAALRDRASSY